MVCRGAQYIILVGWSCDHILAVVGQSQSELLYSCEVDGSGVAEAAQEWSGS